MRSSLFSPYRSFLITSTCRGMPVINNRELGYMFEPDVDGQRLKVRSFSFPLFSPLLSPFTTLLLPPVLTPSFPSGLPSHNRLHALRRPFSHPFCPSFASGAHQRPHSRSSRFVPLSFTAPLLRY